MTLKYKLMLILTSIILLSTLSSISYSYIRYGIPGKYYVEICVNYLPRKYYEVGYLVDSSIDSTAIYGTRGVACTYTLLCNKSSALDDHYIYISYMQINLSKIDVEEAFNYSKIVNIYTTGDGKVPPEYGFTFCSGPFGLPGICWVLIDPGYNYIIIHDYSQIIDGQPKEVKITPMDIPSLNQNYPDNSRTALIVILSPHSGFDDKDYYSLSDAIITKGARAFIGFNNNDNYVITSYAMAEFNYWLYVELSGGSTLKEAITTIFNQYGPIGGIDNDDVVLIGNRTLILVG